MDLRSLNFLLDSEVVKSEEIGELLETHRIVAGLSRVEFTQEKPHFRTFLTSENASEELKFLDSITDPYHRMKFDFTNNSCEIMPFNVTPEELSNGWEVFKNYENFVIADFTYVYPNDERLLSVYKRLDGLGLIDKVSFIRISRVDLAFGFLLADVKDRSVWKKLADGLIDELTERITARFISDVLIYQETVKRLISIGLESHPLVELVNKLNEVDLFFELFEFLPNVKFAVELMAHSQVLGLEVNDEMIRFVEEVIDEVEEDVGSLLDYLKFDVLVKCDFDEVIKHWSKFFDEEPVYQDCLEKARKGYAELERQNGDYDLPF